MFLNWAIFVFFELRKIWKCFGKWSKWSNFGSKNIICWAFRRTSLDVRPQIYRDFFSISDFQKFKRFWAVLPLIGPFWRSIFGSRRIATFFIFRNLSDCLKTFFIFMKLYLLSSLELYYTNPGYLFDWPSISISWGAHHEGGRISFSI